MFFSFDWQVKLIISYLEDFFSSAKPLLNHATIAWFSLYKKNDSLSLIREKAVVFRKLLALGLRQFLEFFVHLLKLHLECFTAAGPS